MPPPESTQMLLSSEDSWAHSPLPPHVQPAPEATDSLQPTLWTCRDRPTPHVPLFSWPAEILVIWASF